jgi:diguanylate cyclase (GGDEF)-like protein/PAS domain S-box-containing protein
MICMVGLHDLVMYYVSPSCEHVLGWSPQEMLGKGPEVFVLDEDLPIVAEAQKRLFIHGRDELSPIIRMRKKNGAFAWIETNARIVKDEITGEPKSIVIVMRNITERKLREEELEVMAFRDSLTGLANRRLFDLVLEREWNRTLREGTEMSLILLDIDHFKQFNDHYGHLFGDDCLRAIARAIQNALARTLDLAARYGGEEIAIILPGTDAAGALQVAERLRTRIEALRIPHNWNSEGSGFVTASFGLATALARCGGTMKMPESLLLAADNALYKAKSNGRNRVETAHLLATHENGFSS